MVVGFLNMSAIWRPQAVFLFRTLGILVTTLFIHTLFQLVLNARQRYAWSTAAGLVTYGLYVVGFVIVIETGGGLRGVAFIFVGQQVLASVLIIPVAVRYLDRRGIGLIPWNNLRSIISFSGKLQVGGIASLVVTEVDSLVIGGALSVHALGIYSPGANFANQLSSVVSNALTPAGVHLSHVYGREGEQGTLREFRRLQRMWVVAVTGWTMVAMASAYFGVVAWLGPRFQLSGWICIVLTAGASVPLVTGLIGGYVTAVGKAGALARYGVVSMVVNIVLTVPMVLLGSLGVVTATAIGQLVAAIYMLHDVRRTVQRQLPNPLRYVPLLRGVAAAALTVGLEVVIQPYLPIGALGLLAAGVPAAVGLGRSAPSCSALACRSGCWPIRGQPCPRYVIGQTWPKSRSRRPPPRASTRLNIVRLRFLLCPRCRRCDAGSASIAKQNGSSRVLPLERKWGGLTKTWLRDLAKA